MAKKGGAVYIEIEANPTMFEKALSDLARKSKADAETIGKRTG